MADASGSDDTGQDSLEPGFLVGGGRFTLEEKLAVGPNSAVWIATDTRLAEKVVLKIYPPSLGREALQALRRSALRSRKLSHPHIVRLFDVHEEADESLLIAMERLPGENLRQRASQRADQIFTWDDLRPVAHQAASALAYAHAEQCVHGNLKPENILLENNSRVKITDFGLRVSSPNAASISDSDLAYLSPQKLDSQAPLASDDLYALGAILYEMLTGKPLFWRGDLQHQIRKSIPQPIGEALFDRGLPNDVPPETAALIMSCVAKSSTERPTAEQLMAHSGPDQRHAEDAKNDRVISLMPPKANAPKLPVADPWREVPAEMPRESSSSWKWLAAFGAILVVALVALQMGRGRTEPVVNEAASNVATNTTNALVELSPPVLTAGIEPNFIYRYEPRKVRTLDTNALNEDVEILLEGPDRANCAFIIPAGKTNPASGTITYEFRTQPGYVIQEMNIHAGAALFTHGQVRGYLSTNLGNTFATFFATPPFTGDTVGHELTTHLPTLNATNVLIRFSIVRLRGEHYNVQFLRDADDAPVAFEVHATVLPLGPG